MSVWSLGELSNGQSFFHVKSDTGNEWTFDNEVDASSFIARQPSGHRYKITEKQIVILVARTYNVMRGGRAA